MLDDKYTYPGSNGVLINKYGIRDQAQLDAVINDYVTLAEIEVNSTCLQETGFAELQEIHRKLFGAILPSIAGKVRDVDASAHGTSIVYCRPAYIAPALHDVFTDLERNSYLSQLPPDQFANSLADTWAYITQIHPFRDGNTRSQSLYFDRLARAAGYFLRWDTIDPAVFRQV